ncbi:hypothetical protein A361_15495 [Cytobacillus oceanisediminis 2691]|uniref:Uncharacterized protein n=1 Tax=Cytobacillus oceanisediminis 2691 TaxID=1196031 RepID=A0A160MCP2_9BACI|nr:hypothetical protein A361_15495 [Cytobacillus oceanisediminis 2691]
MNITARVFKSKEILIIFHALLYFQQASVFLFCIKGISILIIEFLNGDFRKRVNPLLVLYLNWFMLHRARQQLQALLLIQLKPLILLQRLFHKPAPLSIHEAQKSALHHRGGKWIGSVNTGSLKRKNCLIGS